LPSLDVALAKYALSLESDLAEAKGRVEELEHLFQRTHGVHVSWVEAATKRAERIAELEKGLSNCLEHELTRAILREVPAPRKRGRR
jgi:TolA-binding protein